MVFIIILASCGPITYVGIKVTMCYKKDLIMTRSFEGAAKGGKFRQAKSV
jgi:hypothetical protein